MADIAILTVQYYNSSTNIAIFVLQYRYCIFVHMIIMIKQKDHQHPALVLESSLNAVGLLKNELKSKKNIKFIKYNIIVNI